MPNRRPNVTCDVCQKPIYRRPSTLAMQAMKFCSKGCRNRVYRSPKGPNPAKGHKGQANHAWKGGVTFKRNKGNYIGPKYVRCPSEFMAMARKDGYVMEHRLVVARRLGRCLQRIEVVHHRDHNTRNNADENLELFESNGVHKREEARRLASARCAAA